MYKVIQFINYPWISRMDRKVYEKYPELDPVKMGRYCLVAGVAGYWLGKVKRWNKTILTVGFAMPFLIKFMTDEWRLSSELTPASTIDFKKYPKLEW